MKINKNTIKNLEKIVNNTNNRLKFALNYDKENDDLNNIELFFTFNMDSTNLLNGPIIGKIDSLYNRIDLNDYLTLINKCIETKGETRHFLLITLHGNYVLKYINSVPLDLIKNAEEIPYFSKIRILNNLFFHGKEKSDLSTLPLFSKNLKKYGFDIK
jgi:hypothetical protein